MRAIKDLIGSFNPKSYNSLTRKSIISTIKFFSLFLIAYVILLSLTLGSDIFMAPSYLNIPDMYIENGHLSSQAEQPHTIIDGETKIILDTRPEAEENLNLREGDILISGSEVIRLKAEGKKEQMFDITKMEDMQISQDKVEHYLRIGLFIIVPIFMVFAYMGIYVWLIVYSSIFSGIFALFFYFRKRYVKFSLIWKTSLFALCPSLLISFITGLFGISFRFKATVIYLAYLAIIFTIYKEV